MRYLVILHDLTWNNLYYIGEYSKLEDAIPDINDNLPEELRITELKEYASTFSMVFDKEIPEDPSDDYEGEFYMVRGFILDENTRTN